MEFDEGIASFLHKKVYPQPLRRCWPEVPVGAAAGLHFFVRQKAVMPSRFSCQTELFGLSGGLIERLADEGNRAPQYKWGIWVSSRGKRRSMFHVKH
jgi:hypothetical protein